MSSPDHDPHRRLDISAGANSEMDPRAPAGRAAASPADNRVPRPSPAHAAHSRFAVAPFADDEESTIGRSDLAPWELAGMTERPPSLPAEQPAPWQLAAPTSTPWPAPLGLAEKLADPYDAFAPLAEDLAIERERPFSRGRSVFGDALAAPRPSGAGNDPSSNVTPPSRQTGPSASEPETVPFDWFAAAANASTIAAAPADDDPWALPLLEPAERHALPTPPRSPTSYGARTFREAATEGADDPWSLADEPQLAAAAGETDPTSTQTAVATMLVALIVIGVVIVVLLLFTPLFR